MPGIPGIPGLYGRVPGSSFELIIIMGLALFGPDNGVKFACNFDFQGRIYVKVESAFFAKYQISNA